MATLEKHPTSQNYLIRFRYKGRSYKRSLKTRNRVEAEASRSRVLETISMVQRGFLEMPEDADPVSFFLSAGKVQSANRIHQSRTLGELFTKYELALPAQAKEKTTLSTEKTHIKRFRQRLPLSRPLAQLTTYDIQLFINAESNRKFRNRSISPDTIKRHIDTLKCIFNWAEKQQLVSQVPKLQGLVYGKRDEKLPFMTRAEIERIISRGALTLEATKQLWDSLYLTIPEVHEILAMVKSKPRYPFMYPLLAFVAFTGARRSEALRVTIDDVDLTRGTVLIRERKRSRVRSTTFRRVEIPANLLQILVDWIAVHPGGQSLFSQNFESQGSPANEPLTVDQARIQFRKTFRGTKWDVIRGFHVFRHSYASNLAAMKVDQRIIDSHMGHQTEEMRKRYQHLTPDVCRQAIQCLAYNGVAEN